MSSQKQPRKESYTWIPEEGDELHGTLTRIEVRENDYGKYPMLVVDDGERLAYVHGYHSVLTKRLRALVPQPGDDITIYYGGLKTSKNGNEYHYYEVTSSQDTVNWDIFSEKSPAPRSDLSNDVPWD